MKKETFKVIDFIRELIVRVEKELENFPKKDIEIKNRIKSNSYDLLELAYEANSTINIKDKEVLIFKIIGKIKTIDFLLNLSYDNGLITAKKYYKLGQKIDDIAKFANGWVTSLIRVVDNSNIN